MDAQDAIDALIIAILLQHGKDGKLTLPRETAQLATSGVYAWNFEENDNGEGELTLTTVEDELIGLLRALVRDDG